MPITRAAGGKGPDHGLPTQAILYMGIPSDIIRVVIIDELKTGYRPIQGKGDQGQQERNNRRVATQAAHGDCVLLVHVWTPKLSVLNLSLKSKTSETRSRSQFERKGGIDFAPWQSLRSHQR